MLFWKDSVQAGSQEMITESPRTDSIREYAHLESNGEVFREVLIALDVEQVHS
jgi:hypothetical protein